MPMVREKGKEEFDGENYSITLIQHNYGTSFGNLSHPVMSPECTDLFYK